MDKNFYIISILAGLAESHKQKIEKSLSQLESENAELSQNIKYNEDYINSGKYLNTSLPYETKKETENDIVADKNLLNRNLKKMANQKQDLESIKSIFVQKER